MHRLDLSSNSAMIHSSNLPCPWLEANVLWKDFVVSIRFLRSDFHG
ncbi:hypothetical protein Q31b_27920 [Novipirellula aureliae]|uniref:Uncharacterized protein n=1 Tax=Novipirellula aureliae TaxID=2527966 RepID=A0A5C6DXG6_9BACT|nr:hypothetical protein Q31b_27920 [Novipirellula aureliae]